MPLITTGRLGDIFGYRRLYVIGIITFTAASALCGLAGSPSWLLAARLLQRLGGALLFPQVISPILTIFPARQRGRAFGVAVLTAVGSAYAGRLSDRFGGKYILMTGLALLATGLLVPAVMAGPDTDAWSLLPGLLIIGIAGGATFAPLQQATMDGLDPRLAGEASGVSSTIRQVGGVLGTAVLGALLAARLASALREEAEKRAGALPAHLRARFVDDSAAAARHYRPPTPPGGLDAATAGLYGRVTADTFATGFVTAMQTAFVACAVALVIAALCCLMFGPPGRPRD
ncbi:MFS transporter [Spongiactinospora gelatinilytica]|uniref:MFS transporter n=1 Tax=Spongiactinospora gelatinilytica TaxID=2666298 RepID=UPI0013147E1A|nr:MFS transporter [Spongiactinospora gelatinilytica]